MQILLHNSKNYTSTGIYRFRASALQAEGRRFEPVNPHKNNPV